MFNIEARDFLKIFTNGEPEQQSIDVLTRMKDPYYLPTYIEVLNSFTFQRSATWDRIDWSYFITSILPYTMYECFTQEYIAGLTEYLSKRIEELYKTKDAPIVILDPCAGNGRLPYFLNERLMKLVGQEKFQIVAVDDNSWQFKTKTNTPIYSVEGMDYKEAIQKYQSDIIVASWISSSNDEVPSDWIDYFRSSASVDEYLLIGRPYWDSKYDPIRAVQQPMIHEGFERFEHDDLYEFQLCHEDTDENVPGKSVSKTVSFIRSNSHR